MVRRDGAEVRRDRIQQIAQYIQKELYSSPNGWILLNKTIAILMLEHGLTRGRLMEYLETLQAADYFEKDVENNQIKRIEV